MVLCRPFYEVEFEVIANLGHGEVPVVGGDCPSLGDFNPHFAVRLLTTPETYPIWRSKPVALPLGRVVNYKYGIISGGQLRRWERCSTMRVLEKRDSSKAALVVTTTGDILDKDKPQPISSPNIPSLSTIALQDAENELDGIAPYRPILQRLSSNTPIVPLLTQQSHRVKFAAIRQNSSGGGTGRSDSWREESPIRSYDGVVVASFFLPVTVTRLEEGGWHVEWDYENLLSLHSSDMHLRVTRVGIVRYPTALTPEDEEALTKALVPFDCTPVFLERGLARRFYRDFCKGILWPVFHHVVDVYGDLVMKFFTQLNDLWQCYANVNRRFRDKIVEVYNEGDLIWIHGFHLLLLPSFLTRVLRVARIGLFLHTPFPSSEIFRMLPFREDLLCGMLNADQIGFHLYEYARHFITCCRRILGLNEGGEKGRGKASQATSVFYNGRTVTIESIHAGIEPSVIENVLGSGTLDRSIAGLQDMYKGRFVFLGIDKVERLKGLPLKLAALQRLVEADPSLAEKICLVQVGLSVHEREDDFKDSSAALHSMAKAINEAHSTAGLPLVVYIDQDEASFTLHQRLPYMVLADCLINTAVRDGLNRLPLEFAIAHTAWRPQNPGVLMLSEFTSCMRILRGSVRINPWKIDEVVTAMRAVLGMDLEERIGRHAKDEHFVLNHKTSFWADQILRDLKAIPKIHDRSVMSPVGLGLNFRVIGMDAGFSQLDNSALLRAYRPAKHRIIFLDYGGTIMPEEKQKDIMHFAVATKVAQVPTPPPALLALLTRLCQDPRNTVFVVSGREREAVSVGLGSVRGLGIAAEHGLYYRWPKTDRALMLDTEHGMVPASTTPQWDTLVPTHDQSWQQLTKSIMDIYVKRTHGTYIEEKGSAMLWQFRDADPEFGYLQSKELEDHLISVLTPFSLEVLRGGGGDGGGYLEVRPQGVNKGAFADAMLERMISHGTPPDFVLAIGDEASDENMFTRVNQFKFGAPAGSAGLSDCFTSTCTVGKKPSEAQAYLNDIEEVHELLGNLAKVSSSVARNYSTSYLEELGTHHQGPVLRHHLEDMVSSVGTAVSRKSSEVGESQLGGRQQANFHDLSVLSAKFQAEGSGGPAGLNTMSTKSRSISVATFMPTHNSNSGSNQHAMGDFPASLLTPPAVHTAPTMSAYFQQIREDDEEEDGIFF